MKIVAERDAAGKYGRSLSDELNFTDQNRKGYALHGREVKKKSIERLKK
jgi:hypothetical protein